MADAAPTIDALGQFKLHHGLGLIGKSVNFTQANTMMLVGAVLVLFLLVYGMRPARWCRAGCSRWPS